MGKRRDIWGGNGNAKRKLTARLRKEGRPCALCGMPIDYDLPAGHPWSFELDHIVPLSRGGAPYDYANVQAAHRICNERKGNRMAGAATEIRRTRLW
ncbi:HNH endonuclease [Olsenella urininfantis]|uniref:HNH endonuclease n=1 Tax=Olsenella urininfantis TaxID=1871033 RepID=UPI0009872D27|nr:HNH endonuclease [Olsenella urininfantis]